MEEGELNVCNFIFDLELLLLYLKCFFGFSEILPNI